MELRYFTEVDHHDHEALVAIQPDGDGVGVARYVRGEEDSTVAEVAVAVIDEWQGHGVGSRLLSMLAERAREEGITSFSAYVLADNELMLNLPQEIGNPRVVRSELGTVELIVDLSAESGLERLRRLLGAVARGEIVLSWPLFFPAGHHSSSSCLATDPASADSGASPRTNYRSAAASSYGGEALARRGGVASVSSVAAPGSVCI
jgi:predicted GNAT family acetyltransferase